MPLQKRPKVGERAERRRAVTARDIELFTEISGDQNRLHYDGELAKATKFGGIIVQGGITGAVEVVDVREDKPITKLRTTVTRDDRVLALEGEDLCYTMPLGRTANVTWSRSE